MTELVHYSPCAIVHLTWCEQRYRQC